MNILLITDSLDFPNSAHRDTVGGTTAISDLVKYWTQEHNVLCIREVTFSQQNYFKYCIRKFCGIKTILDDIPKKYILDGIVTYPVIWEYTHLFQLTGGRFNHYMDRKINRILKEMKFKPDVIVSHMPSYSVTHYIKRIKADVPKVAVLHGADMYYLTAESGIICGKTVSRMRIKALDSAFDSIYTRSYSIYDRAKELRLKHLSAGIVMSGVQRLVPASRRQWERLALGRISILYAGSLIEQKGVQKVLQALDLLRQQFMCEFRIIGTGDYEEKLRELVDKLNLKEQVKFLGKKTRKEVMQYMQDADIFIMPSYHETLGLVYLEAMSMGCITVGSKGEGIDGIIIDGQNGFLVDPYDEEDIAKTLNKIVNLPQEEIQKISDTALNIANMYSEEKMAEQYLDLVKKAMAAK